MELLFTARILIYLICILGLMAAHDDDWGCMLLPQTSNEWHAGLYKFIDTIFEGTYVLETAPCPCSKCRNIVYKTKNQVQMDLVTKGFDADFVKEKGTIVEPNWDDDRHVADTGDDASCANNLLSSLIRCVTSGDSNEEQNESAKNFF